MVRRAYRASGLRNLNVYSCMTQHPQEVTSGGSRCADRYDFTIETNVLLWYDMHCDQVAGAEEVRHVVFGIGLC